MSKPRSLDLTVDIDATLEEVWNALTTGEGIARWFGPYAAVTPGEGGSVSIGWDPKEMWDSPITVWEPLRRMQTASEMPSKDGSMVRLAVDYYLEALQGGKVRVRLVHSGFDDSDSWDGYIDGLDAGWTFFLFNLKHALERHRGVPRRQLSARFRTVAKNGDDHPVFGAKGLRVQPPVGTLRPGDKCRLSLGGAQVDATVAVKHADRTAALHNHVIARRLAPGNVASTRESDVHGRVQHPCAVHTRFDKCSNFGRGTVQDEQRFAADIGLTRMSREAGEALLEPIRPGMRHDDDRRARAVAVGEGDHVGAFRFAGCRGNQ